MFWKISKMEKKDSIFHKVWYTTWRKNTLSCKTGEKMSTDNYYDHRTAPGRGHGEEGHGTRAASPRQTGSRTSQGSVRSSQGGARTSQGARSPQGTRSAQGTRGTSAAGHRTSSAGTPRGRASSSGSSRTSSAGRPPGSRPNHSGYSSSGRRGRKRRRSSVNYRVIAIVGVILILAITAVVYGMQHSKKTNTDAESLAEETTSEPETELEKQVVVDGIQITGMSRSQAREEILKKYHWDMKAVYGEETYDIANLMEEKLNGLLDEIYTGEAKESYTLDTTGLEEAVKAQAAAAAAKWDKAPKNGSISGYDAATDTFLFDGEETGLSVDQEKLAADIQSALTSKKFDSVIQVTAQQVEPEISAEAAKEKYKTIGSYTTKTTANKKRNTNIRLASEALNGTIVQPGEELSFNDTVGERTAAKGYQGAAAYNNGEVVEEIGGGVCQVSTTLYNAVLRAGLEISVRRSHTFEPSYVTPGQDATVSWGGPDFKFINNSATPIGLRASYADQVVKISVYGIPVLEEGVVYELESKKIAVLDPPAPTYEEDQTLQLDEEVVKSAGSSGSRWETRLVITKDGVEVSREVDHTATYKGHAPVIRRNTSGVVVTTEGSESAAESSDASSAGETSPSSQPAGPGELGPGQPSTEASQPETSPQPPQPQPPAETGNGGGPGGQPSDTIVPEGPGGQGGGAPLVVEPKPE